MPGVAHAFTMWGFIVLILTIIETLGAVFIAQDFAIPFIGRWPVIGFIEDLFIVLVLLGLAIFAVIRLRTQPEQARPLARDSSARTPVPPGCVLFMIFNVIWTLWVATAPRSGPFRSTRSQEGNYTQAFPFHASGGAFASEWLGRICCTRWA
ncbi:MAG: hypothetical protein V9G10_12215 [Candidatus Nanopelagicales bacterium]